MGTYSLADAIKEHFDIRFLTKSQKAEYFLICRYEDKVSERLKARKLELRTEGNQLLGSYLRRLLHHPTPVLTLFPRFDTYWGAYFLISDCFKKDENEEN